MAKHLRLSKGEPIVKPLEIKLSTAEWKTKAERSLALWISICRRIYDTPRALPPSTTPSKQKPLILEHTQASFIVSAWLYFVNAFSSFAIVVMRFRGEQKSALKADPIVCDLQITISIFFTLHCNYWQRNRPCALDQWRTVRLRIVIN